MADASKFLNDKVEKAVITVPGACKGSVSCVCLPERANVLVVLQVATDNAVVCLCARAAYFNDSQRQATKDAGKIAGLEVRACRIWALGACMDQSHPILPHISMPLDAVIKPNVKLHLHMLCDKYPE